MKAKREITITITLDDADSEVLEIAAGILDKDPDALLVEMVADPLRKHIKMVIDDLRATIGDDVSSQRACG